ncbi:ion transporter [Rhodobacteraceae bacterium W635]|uniref:ion transporter n=1 Tax=Nioella halotolerans TaxID=2303578 RepID=UPI000E3DD0CE|nr:ion transporter [Rhodobacteraceae bacterium W635]
MARAGIIAALDGTHARIGRSVALGVHGLIIVSAIAIAVETIPGLDPALRRALLWVEYTTLSVFAAEYLLRLTCSPRPLRYAVSFWGIVDFLAVVPAILFLLPDAQSIRSLRLLRLIRLLKLFYASRALDRLAGAFEKNRAELLIFTLIALVMLYLAAVGIHHFEHEAQPETFGSIPASLWWALATLTTVGYGDVYPITPAGRAFTGVVLLIGLGVIAVPAALITTALLETKETPQPDPNHKTDPNTDPNKET